MTQGKCEGCGHITKKNVSVRPFSYYWKDWNSGVSCGPPYYGKNYNEYGDKYWLCKTCMDNVNKTIQQFIKRKKWVRPKLEDNLPWLPYINDKWLPYIGGIIVLVILAILIKLFGVC